MRIKHRNIKKKKNKHTDKRKHKKKPIPTWFVVCFGGPTTFNLPGQEYARGSNPFAPTPLGPYNSHAEAYAATFATLHRWDGAQSWSVVSIEAVGASVHYHMSSDAGPGTARIDRAWSKVYL